MNAIGQSFNTSFYPQLPESPQEKPGATDSGNKVLGEVDRRAEFLKNLPKEAQPTDCGMGWK